jgi:hypothetical protein
MKKLPALSLADDCLLSSVKILIMHQYYLRLFTVNGERKLIYHTNVMMMCWVAVIVQIASMMKRTKMVLDNLKRIIKRLF